MGKIKKKTIWLQSRYSLPLKEAEYLAAHLVCKQSQKHIEERLIERKKQTENLLINLLKKKDKLPSTLVAIEQLTKGVEKYFNILSFLYKHEPNFLDRDSD